MGLLELVLEMMEEESRQGDGIDCSWVRRF